MPAQIVIDQNFEEVVLNSEIPVLIDFWGHNCQPCMRLSPIIDQIAEKYLGKVQVVKINATDYLEIAEKFEISTVPTVMLYHQEVIDSFTGLPPNPMVSLVKMIEQALN